MFGWMWSMAAALAGFPVEAPMDLDIHIRMQGPQRDGGPRGRGPDIAGIDMALSCQWGSPTRKGQLLTCRYLSDTVTLWAPPERAPSAEIQSTRLAVDPTVRVEALFREDGRIRWVQPRGPEQPGLADWTKLALAGLELQRVDGDLPDQPWAHRGSPLALELAGTSYQFATSLAYRCEERQDGVTTVIGSGRGAVDPQWLAERLEDAPTRVDIDADGRWSVDAQGVVQQASVRLWLTAADGSRPGTVGGQVLRLTRRNRADMSTD